MKHTQPLWLSEQTTVITSPPKKPADAPEGPRVDSVKERTTAIVPPPSSDPPLCDDQETKVWKLCVIVKTS